MSELSCLNSLIEIHFVSPDAQRTVFKRELSAVQCRGGGGGSEDSEDSADQRTDWLCLPLAGEGISHWSVPLTTMVAVELSSPARFLAKHV